MARTNGLGRVVSLWGMVCGLLLLISAPLSAQTSVSTDPQGYYSVNCLSNSDTIVGLGFHRPAVFAGAVSAVSGSDVSIQYSDTAPFQASQFVYNPGATTPQTDHFYLLVKSGELAGAWFEITANTTSAITIVNAGYDLGKLTAGTTLEIIPFWTLGTLMPQGGGLPVNTVFSGNNCEILLPDKTTIGTKLAPNTRYYYYSGASAGGPGWRKIGTGSTICDTDPLNPETYIIIRNKTSTAAPFIVKGAVQMSQVRVTVATLQADTGQDNSLSLAIPVPMTLSQLGLYESGAFAGNSVFSPADELQVYDNSVVAVNKAISARYYYYTGTTGGGPGWRKIGTGTTIQNDAVLEPGCPIVIRKKATTQAISMDWTVKPAYVP